MQPELALQKLTEAREAVEGDTAEMIDAIARMIILQQDISHPMLGAKVTLHLRPDTEDRIEVDPEEAPDPDSNNWSWQWSKSYQEGNYLFTPKVNEDDPDLMSHQAIVIEGNVAGDAPEGELWDPNKKEFRTADEYPIGTVNVVVNKRNRGIKPFSDNYCTDVEVYTSITPAKEDPKPHTYTPGWN